MGVIQTIVCMSSNTANKVRGEQYRSIALVNFPALNAPEIYTRPMNKYNAKFFASLKSYCCFAMNGRPFQITLVPADAKAVNPSDADKRVLVVTSLPR